MRFIIKTILIFAATMTTGFGLQACSDHGNQIAESPPITTVGQTNDPSAEQQLETGDVNSEYASLRQLDLIVDKTPPRMMPEVNTDLKRVRNYPEQPPTIPHKVEYYQIDKKHNQCMDCHSRANVGVSQAPMVSISHFMGRDGQFLASISARRYYCTQCHVAQLEVDPLIENTFVDIDEVIKYLESEKQGKDGGHK